MTTIHPHFEAFALYLSALGIAARAQDVRAKLGRERDPELSDFEFLADTVFDLEAQAKTVKPRRLRNLPAPFMAETLSGDMVVVEGLEGDEVKLFDPENRGKPKTENLSNLTGKVLIGKLRTFKDDMPFGWFWIIAQVLRRRLAFGQVLTSTLFIQIFALVTPLFTMVIIDKIFSATTTTTLEVLLIALVAIAVFDFLIGVTRKLLLSHVMNRVDVSLATALYRKLTHLPMGFFAGKSTGDSVSRLKDVEGIRAFISSSAISSFIDLPFAVVFLVVMAMFSLQLTIVVAISITLSFLLYAVVGPFLKKRMQAKHQLQGDSQAFLIESMVGLETIKASAAEARFQRSWDDQVADQTRFSQASDSLTNTVGQVAGFINKATVALTLYLGAKLVMSGQLTAGQLIAFNMLVGRVSAPSQRVAQMMQSLQQTIVSMNRVKEVYDAAPEPAYGQTKSVFPNLMGRIDFQNVDFGYGEEPDVLHDINFTVEPGTVVGVVGSSGSGKSSIMRLLQRLAVPRKGRLLIDGINISQVDPVWLRSQIGVVLQDNLLFDKSIKENILIGHPHLGMDDVERVAQLAGADEFIRALPQGFDTKVGERGLSLSTGQRQRIAIARALVGDPKILILDEATSALDYESEQIVQANMAEICKGRTVFLVAHRLSTLRIASQILSVEDGRVIENGTPRALLKSGGRFAQLFALHTGRGAPAMPAEPEKQEEAA